jgi:hypothetical protein
VLEAKELCDDDSNHSESKGGAEVAQEGALKGWVV